MSMYAHVLYNHIGGGGGGGGILPTCTLHLLHVQCTVYNAGVQCTVYSVQQVVHCTLYTVHLHYTRYSVQCRLYSVHNAGVQLYQWSSSGWSSRSGGWAGDAALMRKMTSDG